MTQQKLNPIYWLQTWRDKSPISFWIVALSLIIAGIVLLQT